MKKSDEVIKRKHKEFNEKIQSAIGLNTGAEKKEPVVERDALLKAIQRRMPPTRKIGSN